MTMDVAGLGIEISFSSAFLAGVITFLAPCTLPLLPAYLGFISGVPPEQLEDPNTAKAARRKIFLNGLLFVVGFSVVFVVFGTLIGFLGSRLVVMRDWLVRVGGAFVIFFGLFMLGVFNLNFLQSEKRPKIPRWLKVGNPFSSLVIGATFAFGWTPCVGPVLGSILFLAGSSGTALQGALLLMVFSAGLAAPFLVTALTVSRATKVIGRLSKYLKWVSTTGGIFLILLGVLLISNNFTILIEWGYKILSPLEYSNIEAFL